MSQASTITNGHRVPLLLLFGADFAFIVLHIVSVTPTLQSSLFNLAGYEGYAKTYLCIKLFWVIILFAYLLTSTRRAGYVSWLAAFMFLLLGDALQMHIVVGSRIANYFAGYSSRYLILTPQDFGKWAVLASAGIVLCGMLAWAYWRNPHRFRQMSNDMVLLMAAWAFFAVLVDLATDLELGPAVKFGLEVIEQGGETVVVSLILGYVFLLAVHNGNLGFSVSELLVKSRKDRTEIPASTQGQV